MLNRVILIGRLVQDPELRYTTNGTAVCSFTVAVDRRFASAGGERQADFIDGVVWRQTAEYLASYGSKGRLIAVEGSIQTRVYETKDGQKRKAVEVVADNIKFLDKNPQSQGSAAPKRERPRDDWSELGTEIDAGSFDVIDHDEEEFPF